MLRLEQTFTLFARHAAMRTIASCGSSWLSTVLMNMHWRLPNQARGVLNTCRELRKWRSTINVRWGGLISAHPSQLTLLWVGIHVLLGRSPWIIQPTNPGVLKWASELPLVRLSWHTRHGAVLFSQSSYSWRTHLTAPPAYPMSRSPGPSEPFSMHPRRRHGHSIATTSQNANLLSTSVG